MFFLKENTATVIYFLFFINNFVFQEITAQIVGGVDATIEEFPYIVSLRLDNNHICGGSIISQRHILTAAHCVFTIQHRIFGITVVAGSTHSSGPGGLTYRVFRLALHPGFPGTAQDRLHNDIAVMTFGRNIIFSGTVQKINLPRRESRPGEIAMVSGWGSVCPSSRQPSPILQKTPLTVIDNLICAARLRSSDAPPINPGKLCAYQRRGVGTWFKDSGGPLTANNEIIGVVSYGVPCARGYPDVFTRVFVFKSWIERVMA